MSKNDFLTLSQVAKKLEQPYYKITYAITTGRVSEVPLICGRRVFDSEAVNALREHFDKKNNTGGDNNDTA